MKRAMLGDGVVAMERKGRTGQLRKKNAQEVCAIQRMGLDPTGQRQGLSYLGFMQGDQLPGPAPGWYQAYLGQVCSAGSLIFSGLTGTLCLPAHLR